MRSARAVIATVVLAAMLTTPPAAGQEGGQTGGTHLRLVAQTSWVTLGAPFNVHVAVDDAPSGAQLRISVHDRVRSRSEFARTIQGDSLRRRISDATAVPVSQLISPDGTVALQVPTDPAVAGGVAIARSGVYPVAVDLLNADGDVVEQLITHLVRLAENTDFVPLDVVVVVPVHAPPAHREPGTVELDAAEELAGALARIAAHPTLNLTIVPTPETVAALFEQTTSTPDARAALAARPLVAAPFVRIDEPALHASRMDDFVTAEWDRGADVVSTVLGVEADDGVAVVDANVDDDTLDALAARGVDAVVVPDSALDVIESSDFPVTLTRPFELATASDDTTLHALAADTALAAHAEAADPVLGAHQLLADLAVLAGDEPANERVAVLALSDEALADGPFLDALLTGLEPPVAPPVLPPTDPSIPPPPPLAAPVPAVRAVTLADAFDRIEPAGADGGSDVEDPLVRHLADAPRPRQRQTLREAIGRASAVGDSYRSAFGPIDTIGAELSDLVLIAASADLDDRGQLAVLRAVERRVNDDLVLISTPERQRVTLTARTGVLQLVLTNETGRPVDVVLRLRGERLELPDSPDGILPVHVEGRTTRLDLTVRALSSGDAPLDITVLTPDGRLTIATSRVTVRTTAVSGVGVVLFGGAGAFLVWWWTRTIVRERRARARAPKHLAT